MTGGGGGTSHARPYHAVAFDLLTGLLDSWTLWTAVSPKHGLAWRDRYLRLAYGAGRYRQYESLVSEAASDVGLPGAATTKLVQRWMELSPWPETHQVLNGIRVPIAVVTNCSDDLAAIAVGKLGIEVAVLVTAETAGWYKPAPRPYLLALERLDVSSDGVLFVAGSVADVEGATRVGMDVYWHNRRGVGAGAVDPTYEFDSLEPLTRLL
jgi:2-haloacid dehalogenase